MLVCEQIPEKINTFSIAYGSVLTAVSTSDDKFSSSYFSAAAQYERAIPSQCVYYSK